MAVPSTLGNTTQPTPVGLKHLMTGWGKLSEKRTAHSVALSLYLVPKAATSKKLVAPVLRVRRSLFEGGIFQGWSFPVIGEKLWCDFFRYYVLWSGLARWDRSWAPGLPLCVFYGYFLAVSETLVTCYGCPALGSKRGRVECTLSLSIQEYSRGLSFLSLCFFFCSDGVTFRFSSEWGLLAGFFVQKTFESLGFEFGVDSGVVYSR